MSTDDVQSRKLVSRYTEAQTQLKRTLRHSPVSYQSVSGLLQQLTSLLNTDGAQFLVLQVGYQLGYDAFQSSTLELGNSDSDSLLTAFAVIPRDEDSWQEPDIIQLEFERGTGQFYLELLMSLPELTPTPWQNDGADTPINQFYKGWLSGWCSAFFGAPVLSTNPDTNNSNLSRLHMVLRNADGNEFTVEDGGDTEALASNELHNKLAANYISDFSNLKNALDHHALVTVSDKDGRIIDVNDRFCMVSKYKREELLGQEYRIFRSGMHSQEYMENLWKTIRRGEVWHGDLCNCAKDRRHFWVYTTILPLLDEDDQPYQYIQICTDISSQKFAAENMLAAKIAADRSNQLKSDFLATMSHEIRTPMNGVLGFANLLLETDLSEAQQHHLEIIRNSGETLLSLLDNILDLSKIEANELSFDITEYDVGQTVADVALLMTPKATEKGLNIKVERNTYLQPKVTGDQGRVRQIILNLIGNAVKFSTKGCIFVNVEKTNEAFIRITVTDNGIGVDQEKVPLLFNKFYQAEGSTTRRFGGTGLGLAISKRLIQEMGGKIGAASKKGLGSTFWITLPVQPSEAMLAKSKTVKPLEEDRPSSTGNSLETALHILFAEDNPTNQLLGKTVLEKMGCTVEVADTGSSAVEKWQHGNFDAILMDCHMPEMDGLEATRIIRAKEIENSENADTKSKIPIIAFTASVMASEQQACYAAGMNEFLPKPLRKEDLTDVLNRLFGRKSSTLTDSSQGQSAIETV